MKDLIIKNMADIPAVTSGNADTGSMFYTRPIVAGEDVDTCAVNFIEVPPGKCAWPYHYHDQSEEMFYIISGQGRLRCFYGEKDVRAGNMVCFPTGEKGGHMLLNTSETEPLVYVDFEVKATKTDIVTMPEDGTFELIGNHMGWTTVKQVTQ